MELKTTLNSLPTEILAEICSNFTHLNRNLDLTNLALVSRRWRPLAHEQMLKLPKFHIRNIALYIWDLGHHEYVSPQVRSLEIFSGKRGRTPKDPNGQPVKQYQPIKFPNTWMRNTYFIRKCTNFISVYTAFHEQDNASKIVWIAALEDDCIPALFGVLLSTLPNLKELRLGHAWLMDFPIFAEMLSPIIGPLHISPWTWKHRFLSGVLSPHLSRLEVLEVPADMTFMHFSRSNTVYDLRRFRNLKEIGITMKALWQFSTTQPFVPDSREIFPSTLELLKISEATQYTPLFLKNLCNAKKGQHFPALRRVEIYYRWSITAFEMSDIPRTVPHVVNDVQKMFQKAALECYVYFPVHSLATWDIMGSPWALRREGQALEESQRRKWGYSDLYHSMIKIGDEIAESHIFEAEWDADGDVVMR